MAIRSREEINTQISTLLGENNSDDVINLMEDIADTMNDLETRANGDGKDWKAEYEKNDKAWRDKYMARFMSGDNTDDNDNPRLDEPKNYRFEDLFSKGDK